MAVPQNGVNQKDKVISEIKEIKKVEDKVNNYNEDAFQVMSDYVLDDVRFLSETQEIQSVGCLHRDTVITEKATTSSLTFIPDVRVVDKMDNEGNKVGLMYISKTMNTINEVPQRRLR